MTKINENKRASISTLRLRRRLVALATILRIHRFWAQFRGFCVCAVQGQDYETK